MAARLPRCERVRQDLLAACRGLRWSADGAPPKAGASSSQTGRRTHDGGEPRSQGRVPVPPAGAAASATSPCCAPWNRCRATPSCPTATPTSPRATSPCRCPAARSWPSPRSSPACWKRLGVGPGHRVLEVGSGSGYAAALLARLGGDVLGVERFRTLAQAARARLSTLGIAGATVVWGDGLAVPPGRGPFDRILVHGVLPGVPDDLAARCWSPDGTVVFASDRVGRATDRARAARPRRRLGPRAGGALAPASPLRRSLVAALSGRRSRGTVHVPGEKAAAGFILNRALTGVPLHGLH